MAAKVKMLTLLQGLRGFAQITNRCPPPRSPELLLNQLRSRGIHVPLRKRKLNIVFEEPNQPAIPLQVKIHHLKQAPSPAASISAA